jgi:hypothetical protein
MTTSLDLFLADGRRVSREDLKRMLPALGYFVERGQMPDADLAKKIREHPANKEMNGVEGRNFMVCHNCESLHYWHREPHDKCGHMLMPLEESAPGTLERILKNITRNWRKKVASDILSARYPLPKENYKDKTYTCLVCQKVFKYDGCNSPDRLACSPRHLFDLMGHPWPQGRKWVGFLTFWGHFRKGVVLYLGTSTINEKKCECYLWRMVPKAKGSIYAYHGDGERSYFHESYWAGQVNSHDELMMRVDQGQTLDESWRIVANTRKTYEWNREIVTK